MSRGVREREGQANDICHVRTKPAGVIRKKVDRRLVENEKTEEPKNRNHHTSQTAPFIANNPRKIHLVHV